MSLEQKLELALMKPSELPEVARTFPQIGEFCLNRYLDDAVEGVWPLVIVGRRDGQLMAAYVMADFSLGDYVFDRDDGDYRKANSKLILNRVKFADKGADSYETTQDDFIEVVTQRMGIGTAFMRQFSYVIEAVASSVALPIVHRISTGPKSGLRLFSNMGYEFLKIQGRRRLYIMEKVYKPAQHELSDTERIVADAISERVYDAIPRSVIVAMVGFRRASRIA